MLRTLKTEAEMREYLRDLVHLGRVRTSLAKECTDPEGWRRLADAYAAIGASSNEASCRERARWYER